MVITTNDLFSMMIIQGCAMADILKGSTKAGAPAVTESHAGPLLSEGMLTSLWLVAEAPRAGNRH